MAVLSTISSPARSTALYNVLEPWQIPPPYICTRTPPLRPPAGSQPFSGFVLSPMVSL